MVEFLKHVLILNLLSIISIPLIGQSEWDYVIARGDSHDVEIFGNTAYVANRSGLLQIDLETNEETLIHPGNHSVEVQGFVEIEMLENGHMWLSSSEDGYLFYYDGSTFTPYCDSLKYVTNLVFADNKLWFFTGGSSSVYQYTNLNQSDLYSFDGTNCVNYGNFDIYGATSDSENRFWFVTEDSIKQFNGDSILESKAMPSDIYELQDYFIDSENRQWIAYGTAPHLTLYDNGNWEETYTNNLVQNFYELEPGKVSAVLRNKKYIEFNGVQSEEVEIFEDLPEDFNILHMETTDSFFYTTEKMFHSARLFWNTPDNSVELFAHDDIIPSTIVDLAKNCFGNLVGSTRNSLYNLIDDEWHPIPLSTDGQDCYLSRFVENIYDCETWVASAQINASNHCKSVWELKVDSLKEYEILPFPKLYLYLDSEKNILLTTNYPAEIHKIDTLGNEEIIPVPGSNAVSDIHFLGTDKMVALSYVDSMSQGRSIRIFENNEWQELNLDTLGISDISPGPRMHYGRDGSIWINEENGFIKYDGLSLSYYPFDYNPISMVEDLYGTYWVTTTDSGLLRWNPDTTIIYNTSNSDILSNACRELKIIDEHLWVNHYYGLTKIKIEPFENTTHTPSVKRLQYQLYPNPSSGQLTITNPLNEFRKIDIFTMNGILIKTYSGKESEWTLNLEAGAHIVKLKQAQGETYEKVIIVK